MNRAILFTIIREQFKLALNKYVHHPSLDGIYDIYISMIDLESYIRPSALGSNVGLIGAFLLDH